VPGLKSLKGLKAVGGTGILKNRAIGKAFEKSVIKKLGLVREGERIGKTGGMKTYRVADAFDRKGNLVEIKHAKQLRVTDQTRDQLEWARETGKKVYFAYDPSYTTNADSFARALRASPNEYSGLFEMLPVV